MPKKRRARQQQIYEWRKKEPDIVDMCDVMQDISPDRTPDLVAMFRLLVTSDGRRELERRAALTDDASDTLPPPWKRGWRLTSNHPWMDGDGGLWTMHV